jgi:hypothetical protein
VASLPGAPTIRDLFGRTPKSRYRRPRVDGRPAAAQTPRPSGQTPRSAARWGSPPALDSRQRPCLMNGLRGCHRRFGPLPRAIQNHPWPARRQDPPLHGVRFEPQLIPCPIRHGGAPFRRRLFPKWPSSLISHIPLPTYAVDSSTWWSSCRKSGSRSGLLLNLSAGYKPWSILECSRAPSLWTGVFGAPESHLDDGR